METVRLVAVDSVYGRVTCDDYGTYQEIAENFSFAVPNHQFMPAFKSGRWDGVVRLFSPRDKRLYLGLVDELRGFCEARGYGLDLELEGPDYEEADVEEFLAREERDVLPFKLRAVQRESIKRAVLDKRRVIVSPTGSGKSLMVHETVKFLGRRALVVVPTVGLVEQAASDFESYGRERPVKRITAGRDKEVGRDEDLVVSTWQSLTRMGDEWFEQFEVVVVDEAHGAKASEMRKILEKCTRASYRLGFTGTLNDEPSDRLVVVGLLGPPYHAAKTHELIASNELSQFDVRVIVLKYPERQRRALLKKDWRQEVDYLVDNEARNRTVARVAMRLRRATLIVCERRRQVDSLASALRERSDRPVHVVHGGVSGEERERIRERVSEESDAIVVATTRTMSTGVNMPSLKYIILATPFKARIKLLQTIGRSLRLSENKTRAILFDVVDDWSLGRRRNYSYSHFLERARIYSSERHRFRVFNMSFSNETEEEADGR